jgi:hypothetical protein
MMSLTSLIWPTDEKNSSMSLARTRCDSCMTKMVRASRSSAVSTGDGDLVLDRLSPRPPKRGDPPRPRSLAGDCLLRGDRSRLP